MVDPPITFIVTYRCPRCQAGLEARSGLAQGWVRCPKCGRASLPPEHMRTASQAWQAAEGDDILVIGPGTERRARHPAESDAPTPTVISGRSVLFGVAFMISLFLGLLSLLDKNTTNAQIFGLLALLFPVLWVITLRRR